MIDQFLYWFAAMWSLFFFGVVVTFGVVLLVAARQKHTPF